MTITQTPLVNNRKKIINMTYKITKEFYKQLKEFSYNLQVENLPINSTALQSLPKIVKDWWLSPEIENDQTVYDRSHKANQDRNLKLQAILNYFITGNFKDSFDIVSEKLYIIKSKKPDLHGDYRYVHVIGNSFFETVPERYRATEFDSEERAAQWKHDTQEIIVIGNPDKPDNEIER